MALGVVLVSMNITFYESLERVAARDRGDGRVPRAARGRDPRLAPAGRLLWVGLAGGGVALLAQGGGTEVQALGIVLAATAGFFWALYILLSVHVGRAFPGASGLAPAMALGAVLVAPWGIISAGDNLRDPQLVGAAVGVGLLSSALPWSLELEALRRLPSHIFSVVLSLEPARGRLRGRLLPPRAPAGAPVVRDRVGRAGERRGGRAVHAARAARCVGLRRRLDVLVDGEHVVGVVLPS